MKRLVALAALSALLLAGCFRDSTAPGETVDGGLTVGGTEVLKYVHDDLRGVGCWIYISTNNSSISCIPDSQLSGNVESP